VGLQIFPNSPIFFSKPLLLRNSLSPLRSLTDPYTSNLLVQCIHLTIRILKSHSPGSRLRWTPWTWCSRLRCKAGHTFPTSIRQLPSPRADYRTHCFLILQTWYACWKTQPRNKLLRIKKTLIPRKSKREEVFLTRLRVGHTRITHSHLLAPASCPHFLQHCLSVDHFFACPLLLSLRFSLNVPLAIFQAVKNNFDAVSHILQYLRLTHIYFAIWFYYPPLIVESQLSSNHLIIHRCVTFN